MLHTPQGFDGAVFGNLPDVMVQALLERSSEVSDALTDRVNELAEQQRSLRERAEAEGIIIKLPDSVPDAEGKTVVAVDGSATVERMAGTDVYAAAAVRVAGYGAEVGTKPEKSKVSMHQVEGLAHGARINQALMVMHECKLILESPADLVLVDGTIFTMILNVGIGLEEADDKHDPLSLALKCHWFGDRCDAEGLRDAIPSLLVAKRIASIPKRSTAANEFESFTAIFKGEYANMSGIATANLILKAGEYTKPLDLPTPRLFRGNAPMSSQYRADLNVLLEELQVVYFRPHEWSPAYRIELAPRVVLDEDLLQRQLALIRKQCVNSSMREPYPLYLADRFVRSLGKGMAAVVEAVRGQVTSDSENVELTSRFISPGRTEPFREVEPE